VRVKYDERAHTFTTEERDTIERAAEQTLAEVRRLLPELPASLLLRVSASKNVLPETGETGSNSQPNVVDWQVDATRPEGVAAIARLQLRPTLFHELNHVDRAAVEDSRTLRDHIVRGGLGTAFERNFAGVSPPWGA
jgi:hypothetical protein